jgi:hypothetical protein
LVGMKNDTAEMLNLEVEGNSAQFGERVVGIQFLWGLPVSRPHMVLAGQAVRRRGRRCRAAVDDDPRNPG